MKLNDAIEHAANGFQHFECPDGWNDCQASRAITLALLDQRPVTGEALVAMGWYVTDWNVWLSPRSNGEALSTSIKFTDRDNRPRWRVNGELITPLKTIGQVRCACLAFGIPMREEA